MVHVEELASRLPRFAKHYWTEGPRPGVRPGKAIWRMARFCAESGEFSEGQALLLVRDFDRRYGGFHRHADGDARLADIVRDAFRSGEAVSDGTASEPAA